MTDTYRTLGRLASLGLEDLYQVPFVLPEKHLDLTSPAECIDDLPVDQPAAAMVRFVGAPTLHWPKTRQRGRKPRPRTQIRSVMPSGEAIDVCFFGDSREMDEQFSCPDWQCLLVTRQVWQDRSSLTLQEFLPAEWVGRVLPIYKGIPRSLDSATIRTLIAERLPTALPVAAEFIRNAMTQLGDPEAVLKDLGANGWSIEQLLQQAHHPHSVQYGQFARHRCHRVAALCALGGMHGEDARRPATPISLGTRERRKLQTPFMPTNDQRNALEGIASHLALPIQGRVLVTGDVGTGKSWVIQLVAASAADDGARVAILLPNATLARQLGEEFTRWFPNITSVLLTGDADPQTPVDVSVVIGTSALLHRLPAQSRDLVLVDEQHRWSRAQREQLLSPTGHLVEFTATPIPRSQALAQLGRVAVYEMRETHAPKFIDTNLYEGREGIRDYFLALRPHLRDGEPLLIVYPKRDVAPVDPDMQTTLDPIPAAPPPEPDEDDRYTVAKAAERWREVCGDRVATLTSDDDDETKATLLKAFVDRKVQILITTTVVEVGLNLPVLYRIVIMRPELHGLMGLHQLRGRVARNGGDGNCDLLCPKPLQPNQRRRLEFFCSTTDGFKIAEFDLQERGAGDLSAKGVTQSGADETFLFGVKLDMQHIEDVRPILERYLADRTAA